MKPPARSGRRSAVAAALAAALLATFIAVRASGGSGGGPAAEGTVGSTTPAPTTSPFTLPAFDPAPDDLVAPRWEVVASLEGSGVTVTDPVVIADDAIQWRARFTCAEGALRVDLMSADDVAASLLELACPTEAEGFSIETGEVRLRVGATGAWQAVVEQQVETPVDEAPLPGMSAATAVASAEVYGIEKQGRGTVALHELSDGARALRFEGFGVPVNTDLYVWLSDVPSPATSAEILAGPHRVLAPLTATAGDQNYALPGDVGIVRTVVIWCHPERTAYAAAALLP